MGEPLRVEHHTTADLDEHVGIIQQQVERSMMDGESRQLAVKIVSGSYDYERDRRNGEETPVIRAWGRNYVAPPGKVCAPRDEACEVERVWDFMVLNCRYVYDPTNIDTFATLKETLNAGGGDCDDAVIGFAALLGSIGFPVIGRVISTKANPEQWVHIYAMVGLPKDDPTKWIPLDITVAGVKPGWEFPDIANVRDYKLV
jgi:hypothetical protein